MIPQTRKRKTSSRKQKMGDRELYSGSVEKYSMGRSTGLRAKNWKTRHMKVTRNNLSIFEKTNSATPKFNIPIGAVSIVFVTPTKSVHPEASGTYVNNMFALRLFENGVFTLLVRAHTPEEKIAWLKCLKEATDRSKGVQFVE